MARKGRGPRGEGCTRGTCWRVVLDTNCFWGSPVAELAALRQRGLSLSLSLDALREAWARSVRDGNKHSLEARIALIAPLLDIEHPIAFSGRMLLTMIGRAPPEMHVEDGHWRRAIRAGWED